MHRNINEATVMVTGGAGFIGSSLVRHLIANTGATVINVDKLTYAGHLASVAPVATHARYRFEHIDICDPGAVRRVLREHAPDIIMHLAAESHVDRSIDGAQDFIQTNIVGTFTLLECARNYWQVLPPRRKSDFLFHHISTDEVYGSLDETGLFSEDSPYQPRSPYAASKASSDHLVRAWGHTYGLPVVVTNCSNNYGPYQFPEKLIPLIILNALEGKRLPVYGAGANVRDWLYVEDHVRALCVVAAHGALGATYNIGGHNEQKNIDVVHAVCGLLDEVCPRSTHVPHAKLIEYVTDRPGHDQRYAIDASFIARELGWKPQETFASGLRKTVAWYLDHGDWVNAVTTGKYQRQRLGLSGEVV